MTFHNSLPPFVSAFKDRHGVLRPRFRRAGFSRYLPTDMESGAFRAAYEACLDEAPPTPIRSPSSAVGQLRAILRQQGWAGRGDFIYIVATRRMVKIGFSTNVIDRVQQIQAQTPTRLRTLAAAPGGIEMERQLHKRFVDDRIKGEWFHFSPHLRELADAARKGGTFADIG